MPQGLTFGPPVISVDIEDWPQSTWDRNLPITPRAAANTQRVLHLLRGAGVRATMFVLGKFAETFPGVVRKIHAEGHEVACHGYGHVEIFKQSRQEFAKDVHRSKDILEQILGERINGYRAPDFSIVHNTLWALEVLAEMGFRYDSSIFPVRRPRYGIAGWPIAPVSVCLTGDKSIVEVPIATVRYMGKNWPVGGGGYHRLLPGFASRYFAKKIMASGPFIFYCHPYEFDPREFKEMPIIIPLHVRLHQGIGRRWFMQRFKGFLDRFGGQPIEDFLSSKVCPEFVLDSFTPPRA
jgi:polysaccharide deacetylase family protein (PEP-CTERM system associated)